jgi:osmotically-inducible protein OsmY
MRRILLILMIAIGAVSVLTACDETSGTGGGSSTTMTDSQLENNVRSKLNTDAQLKGANLGVSANASKNDVTLSGTVDSQNLRTRAVELAKSANAGLIVNDKIEVKPKEMTRAEYTEDQARTERAKAKNDKETIGDSLDDAWIHTKIVAKLIGNTTTPERKINVDVVNNVVTLRGTVDTPEQRAEAERVAKNTDGVKNVVNQLKLAGKAKA